jgi:hypothetical protein
VVALYTSRNPSPRGGTARDGAGIAEQVARSSQAPQRMLSDQSEPCAPIESLAAPATDSNRRRHR